MRFAVHHHQNKGNGLARLLINAGHIMDAQSPDILLIDHDGPPYYRSIIEQYAARDTKIVVYPHGATSFLSWDGIWEPSEHTIAYLSFCDAQGEVMQDYGYPKPIYTTGWHWCELKPYQKPSEAETRRLLFAPIHPLNNGYLHPDRAGANRAAFMDLLEHVDPQKVSVRLFGTPEQNGVWFQPGVEYHHAYLDNSTDDIDAADLVVSHGTFAYLAVARGKQTVMFGQDLPYGDGHGDDGYRYARHFRAYKDFIRYPVSAMSEFPGSQEAIREWRARFMPYQATTKRLQEIVKVINHA